MWAAFAAQLYPDGYGFTVRKREAIPLVMRAVKDILEAKHWATLDIGVKEYDTSSASSTSPTSTKDNMWEGDRYEPPFLVGLMRR